MIDRVRDDGAMLAEWDIAALRALKDVLRGLVWAEQALESNQRVDFARFFSELTGAIDATRFNLPVHSDREDVLVANVVQARGVPFRAVAVLGLAEGEFPAGLGEDPFLREADRNGLRHRFGLALESSVESAEVEYFYETVTRARERLLLTRPRLSDNGALWQPSPFWEETQRLADVPEHLLTTENRPTPNRSASWPELMESVANYSGYSNAREWVQRQKPHRMAAVARAANVLRLRWTGDESHFDGALHALSSDFSRQYGPDKTWSASRLESYRACPFMFFVRHVLGLEPREDPVEGLDGRQLGTIYHRILEEVYQASEVTDPSSLEQLLAALPIVAERVLDDAPRREGFRETAWWKQTRQEIVTNAALSLSALDELRGKLDSKFDADFVPCCHEARFFGSHALTVTDGQDQFRLHGVIDRVDRSSDGRLLIIDYKTGGTSGFGNTAVAKGEKLQLPLYALAARDGLKLGEPVEGFYWHILPCKRSGFTLGGFAKKEARSAIDVAREYAWEAVRQVRQGHFAPEPPDAGCASYCPAAGFCWHYRPGYGG
jgi:ATP-dependent helicase/nuclease subunit B